MWTVADITLRPCSVFLLLCYNIHISQQIMINNGDKNTYIKPHVGCQIIGAFYILTMARGLASIFLFFCFSEKQNNSNSTALSISLSLSVSRFWIFSPPQCFFNVCACAGGPRVVCISGPSSSMCANIFSLPSCAPQLSFLASIS